jgi:hypothetical protein
MNDNLRLLTETVALFSEDSFYVNSYTCYGIILQGELNSRVLKEVFAQEFIQQPTTKEVLGLVFTKGAITINLT